MNKAFAADVDNGELDRVVVVESVPRENLGKERLIAARLGVGCSATRLMEAPDAPGVWLPDDAARSSLFTTPTSHSRKGCILSKRPLCFRNASSAEAFQSMLLNDHLHPLAADLSSRGHLDVGRRSKHSTLQAGIPPWQTEASRYQAYQVAFSQMSFST